MAMRSKGGRSLCSVREESTGASASPLGSNVREENESAFWARKDQYFMGEQSYRGAYQRQKFYLRI